MPAEPELPICVAAFYRFTRIADCARLKAELVTKCAALGIKGTVLLAEEGVNSTIAGSDAAIGEVLAFLRSQPGLAELTAKMSRAASLPFQRLKVKIKREIVTMGVTGIDPVEGVGHYVAPQDWNALICQPDVLVIDTRNDYEVAIGMFAGATDPGTRSFREFPAWFADQREALQGRKLAMYCTGGIRCEKATAWVRTQGFDEVYHLEGGVLKYLEDVPPEQSLWQGECFVFDERVAVGDGVIPGSHVMCEECGRAKRAEATCAECAAQAAKQCGQK